MVKIKIRGGKPEAKTKATTPPDQAVFIGSRGERIGGVYHLPGIYNSPIYRDADGQVIDTSSSDVSGQPIGSIGAVSKEFYGFEIGDIVALPVWDTERLELALSLKEFAIATDAAQALIVTAHKEAYAASEKQGGSLEAYAARIDQLMSELEAKGWLLSPDSGEYQPDPNEVSEGG